jgi:hypothetical protein
VVWTWSKGVAVKHPRRMVQARSGRSVWNRFI